MLKFKLGFRQNQVKGFLEEAYAKYAIDTSEEEKPNDYYSFEETDEEGITKFLALPGSSKVSDLDANI